MWCAACGYGNTKLKALRGGGVDVLNWVPSTGINEMSATKRKSNKPEGVFLRVWANVAGCGKGSARVRAATGVGAARMVVQ